MDKQIQNMDINRSKELFEYEMTQVLIELQGEFDAISGKDLNFAGSAADELNTNIPSVSIPAVEMEENKTQIPETAKMPEIGIPEAEKVSMDINAPEASKLAAPEIPQVEISMKKTDLPEIPGIRSAAETAAAMTVSGDNKKISISADITDMSETIRKTFAGKKEITAEAAKINVPAAGKICIKKAETISVEAPEVNVPSAKIPETGAFSVEIASPAPAAIPEVRKMTAIFPEGNESKEQKITLNINIPDTSLPEIPGITIPAEVHSTRNKEEDEKLAARIKELMEMEIPRPEMPTDFFSSARTIENIPDAVAPDVNSAKEEILKALVF